MGLRKIILTSPNALPEIFESMVYSRELISQDFGTDNPKSSLFSLFSPLNFSIRYSQVSSTSR
jgi:hypothetical protein